MVEGRAFHPRVRVSDIRRALDVPVACFFDEIGDSGGPATASVATIVPREMRV
jgi:hypothetical protein